MDQPNPTKKTPQGSCARRNVAPPFRLCLELDFSGTCISYRLADRLKLSTSEQSSRESPVELYEFRLPDQEASHTGGSLESDFLVTFWRKGEPLFPVKSMCDW